MDYVDEKYTDEPPKRAKSNDQTHPYKRKIEVTKEVANVKPADNNDANSKKETDKRIPNVGAYRDI